jgi:hypothetical protein
MYVRSCRVGSRILIGASFSEGRFLLADFPKKQLLVDIRLSGNCEDDFDVSFDGKWLVTECIREGTWGIGLYSTESKEQTLFVPAHEIVDIVISADGKSVLYTLAGKGNFFRRLDSKEEIKVTGIGGLGLGDINSDYQRFVLPVRKQSVLGLLDMEDGHIETIQIPRKGSIYPVGFCKANHGSWLIACDDSGSIMQIDWDTYKLGWVNDMKRTHLVCISGNGQLIGVEVRNGAQFHVDVLASDTGQSLRKIPNVRTGASPFLDFSVIRDDGTILDLETGAESPGVSKSSWWRALGI